MVRDLKANQDVLRRAIQEHAPDEEALLDTLLDNRIFDSYVDVLSPINDMVVEMQVVLWHKIQLWTFVSWVL